MDQTQKVVTLVFGDSDVAIPLIAEPGSAGQESWCTNFEEHINASYTDGQQSQDRTK
jgi:hypothetical protein